MIDVKNRKNLGVNDFEFLLAFKSQGKPVFFRLIHDSTRGYSRNESCLLVDNQDEYGFMRNVFKRYQRKGYGVYFVVNDGGQKKENICAITAHFGDADFGKVEIGKNTEGKPIFVYRTAEEIEKCKQEFLKSLLQFELEPSIIVETKNGFHFYWLLRKDKPQDLTAFPVIQKAIIKKFNSDPNITNLDRVLRLPNYYHLKNPNEPFLVKCIKFDPQLRYAQSELALSLGCDLTSLGNNANSPNMIMEGNSKIENKTIQQQNILIDSNIPLNVMEREFDSLDEVIDFLRKEDMFQILGISAHSGKAFNCPFHHDEHPSGVIINNGEGYKYFCNSPNCSFHNDKGLDIIDIVSKLKNLNFFEAIQYLCEIYKIRLKNNDIKWIEEQKTKYFRNIELLSDRNFLEKYKNLSRVIRWGIHVIAEINQIGIEHIGLQYYSCEGQSVFFFSNRYLAKRLKSRSFNLINKYVNLFCVLGLLKKLPKDKIPSEFRKTAKLIASRTGQREIHFYIIPPLEQVVDNAEKIAKEMIEAGYSSILSMSKVMVENLFGGKYASEIYGYRTKENQYFKEVDEEMKRIVLEEIKQKGYVVIDDIFRRDIYINREKINKKTKYIQFKRLIPIMIKEYGFKYKKANKDLLVKFGLRSYSYILYCEDT